MMLPERRSIIVGATARDIKNYTCGIDAHHALPRVEGGLFERTDTCDARVVEEHVDPPVPVDDRTGELDRRGLHGHVNPVHDFTR